MSVFVIRRRRFDWPEFSRAITRFAATWGLEEAYPIVDDGRVVFWHDHDELTLPDGREVGDVPGHPLRRLEAGFAVFASFTAHQSPGLLACADGGVIAVPTLPDDGTASPIPDELRRLAERTECGECRCYGYLISHDGGKLTVQTALLTDADGDCTVEPVAEAGLADEPMVRFVRLFTRGRSPN